MTPHGAHSTGTVALTSHASVPIPVPTIGTDPLAHSASGAASPSRRPRRRCRNRPWRVHSTGGTRIPASGASGAESIDSERRRSGVAADALAHSARADSSASARSRAGSWPAHASRLARAPPRPWLLRERCRVRLGQHGAQPRERRGRLAQRARLLRAQRRHLSLEAGGARLGGGEHAPYVCERRRRRLRICARRVRLSVLSRSRSRARRAVGLEPHRFRALLSGGERVLRARELTRVGVRASASSS